MEQFRDFIVANNTDFTLGLFGGVIFLFLLFLILAIKNKKFKKKYYALVEDMDGARVEEILLESNKTTSELILENKKLEDEIDSLKQRLDEAIRYVGIVRYNAFGDLGPELSFSIAFLDEYFNGIVLTNIHGGESSTSYAKPVMKGKSDFSLSVEEMQAIEKAMKREFYSNSF